MEEEYHACYRKRNYGSIGLSVRSFTTHFFRKYSHTFQPSLQLGLTPLLQAFDVKQIIFSN